MSIAVKIIDRETVGNSETVFKLHLVSETITIGDLIAERVRDEVRKFNKNPDAYITSLVMPNAIKNPSIVSKRKHRMPEIDPERHVRTAIESFNQGEFFLFVDHQQYLDIEDKVSLTQQSTVEFIRLIPLVGG
jgi:hypothetical protein